MRCPNCNDYLLQDAKFCPHCGLRLESWQSQEPRNYEHDSYGYDDHSEPRSHPSTSTSPYPSPYPSTTPYPYSSDHDGPARYPASHSIPPPPPPPPPPQYYEPSARKVPVHRAQKLPYKHSQRYPPKKRVNVAKAATIIIPIVIVIVLLISVNWVILPNTPVSNSNKDLWDPGFDVDGLITSNDKLFYEQYPQVPMLYSLSKRTLSQSSDILFDHPSIYGDDLPIFGEQLGRSIALYDWVIEGAQVTVSIDNLANQITSDAGSDRVDQAKAIFEFVANYLEYSVDGAYEFPVTSLLDRTGQCSEYATLLTSLYLASGFKVYYVFTSMEAYDYLSMYHIWIAIYLPEYRSVDSSQSIITSKLGSGWLGLDATANQFDFGELSTIDYHRNILSIVEPVTSVTIYDIAAQWDLQSAGGGRYVLLDVYLKTWEFSDTDRINVTFRVYDHGKATDEQSFSIIENRAKNLSFKLDYDSSGWEGKGVQYITVSVENE